MHTYTRLIHLLWLIALMVICLPSIARAVALFSEESELFLPWASYQGQVYTVRMKQEDENPPVLQLTEIHSREINPTPGAIATVDDDLAVSIPLVSYRGELYNVTLNNTGQGSFEIANATPVPVSTDRGTALSVTQMETKTTAQIATEYPLAILAGLNLRYDVAVYRISYQTQDAFGNSATASGVIGVPLGIQAGAPLLSFQHGTISSRAQAPSINLEATGADIALYLMGARGYLVVVPDYLGFGDSDGLHPFMHAKTLAWSVIDLIRAARALATDNAFPLNGQLFLAGYSEGGYATMAAQREIETHHADELTITASAPMAGAYDLSGTMLQQVLSGDPLPKPMYYPYVLLAYNAIYGFDDDITSLLSGEIAETVVELFDGTHDSDTIDAALPSSSNELFALTLINALESGSYHPLRTALENNDVYRWTPVSPTRLYHCLDDERVPYENSVVATDYFAAAGADIKLETLFFSNHTDCAIPALLNGNTWFDTLVQLP